MDNDSFTYLATRLADDVAPLTRMWRSLTAESTWTTRELWLSILVDGEPTPVLVPIEDIPAEPDPSGIDGLMQLCTHFTDDPGTTTFAFLLLRPGTGALADGDRRWAAALVEAARAAGVVLEPVHHASTVRVEPFRSDDLVGVS